MSQISEDIIIRFINNSSTDEELTAVRAWLEESAENARSLFEMEHIAVLSAAIRDNRYTEIRLRDKIKRRIGREQVRRRKSMIMRISGIAAVLTGVVLAVHFLFPHTPDVRMISVASANESMSVILPDSSVVFLNKNSRLVYPERFASDYRKVELAGEGYFEVSHDAQRPFTVVGRHLSVEVLGTHFNFISNDSTANSVSLIEGSVEVKTDQQPEGVVLEPGQKAIYSVADRHLTVQDANVAIDAVWHDNLIHFENANITEIVDILDDLYDKHIEIDNTIDLSKTYSGETVYYGDIDSTLTRLTHTLPIKFTDEGDRIVICSK